VQLLFIRQKKVEEEIYDKINYKLVVDLAEKAKSAGIKKFIQLSTIAVYGNATHITATTPESPVNPYGKSKLEADIKLLALANDEFKVITLRPPMIYGGKRCTWQHDKVD